MRRFSAQYVITNTGHPLKRAIISADDDGTILGVDDTGGDLPEGHQIEFYNGAIIPGFVNCHAHLELSHMRGLIAEGLGLTDFLEGIRTKRESDPDKVFSAAEAEDLHLYNEGVSLCADICNTPATFKIKKRSKIHYISFIEVFGIDQAKAEKRYGEALEVSRIATAEHLPNYMVPHTTYSVSVPLFRLLKKKMSENRVSTIHFLESEEEIFFFSGKENALLKSYEDSGLLKSTLQIPENHIDAVMNEMTHSGNLILVHNTFADKEIISKINARGNTFWCLCPLSNLYIEGRIPPVRTLIEEECEIVIGTDSLASNKTLSILSELKTLQAHFPELTLNDFIRWSAFNGAKALCKENNFGSIKPGMKPGLLLLENADLNNSRLLPETTVRRLI